ncbi:MAG TPA: two-component regulator propeller domain-containing protein, partial [Saprospiraceae bacterium]|nr:two-component regulator propeller domain-containing protein [Saprospiraceae bacterium]
MRPFFIIFLLLAALVLPAQVPLFRAHPTKSLGNARLKTLAQDREGWMWCGTEEGEVYRYDGLDFQQIKRPDSLRSPVTALADLWGSMWVGYRDGSIAYIPKGVLAEVPAELASPHALLSGMALWQPEEGLPKQPITGFATDHSGGLWIGTYGEGVYVWKNQRLYQFSHADDGMASDDVYALCADPQGRIWVATDAGINICEMPQAGMKKVAHIGTAQGLPDEIVTALCPDQSGNVWVGTHDQGFGCFSAAALERRYWASSWAYGPVSALAAIGSEELWVAAEKDGLLRLDRHDLSLHALPEQHPLRHATLRRLCKDREGLLWSISDRGLLHSCNVRYGALSLPLKEVQCVLRDTQGVLWMGTPQGLVRFAEGRSAVVLTKNVVSLWLSGPTGTLWVGTFDEGAFLLDHAGKVLRHITPADGLPNGSVLSIAGQEGQVWLATLGGVTVCDLQGRVLPVETVVQRELGSSYVYKIMADHRGRIWFCTDGKGLAIYEPPHLRYIRQANGVELRTVYSAVEDEQGRIWFSADQKGLFCYDGSQKFRHYTLSNGLHSLNMVGLAVEGRGKLVIGYEDGFEVLDPSRPDHFVFFDPANGAPLAEMNLNAMSRDAQGNVWMGTRQGVVRVATFGEPFLDDPQPALTAVSVFMQPIDFQRQQTFAHDQNYFLFQFKGLWYTQPDAVNYRYRLESFDPAWRVSKDNQASYSKLPPGRYIFRLQASEHGNFEEVPEISWAFEIEAPIWMKWWFYVLLAAPLAAALWALVKNREARLNREALLKREAVEAQFAALKSQINPHFLFNSFNTLITIIE